MFVNGVESDSLEVNSAVPQGSILSFTHGIFPDNLKIAQVIPLVKQRSSSSCSNYRDLFAITETWLTDDSLDEFYCRDICPEGYNIEQLPRNYADGGGVALVYRRCFKDKKDVQMIHRSFELINIHITSVYNHNLRLVVIYRAPPSPGNGFTVRMFLEEFSSEFSRW